MMYINTAHPDTGGMESHERSNKMNNILRVISEFQKSDYGKKLTPKLFEAIFDLISKTADLEEKPHIKNYLNSVKYIEELQRFLEEDNYKYKIQNFFNVS